MTTKNKKIEYPADKHVSTADEEVEAKEKKEINKHNWDSTGYLWKPKKKSACRIRIMPWPENSEAKWWMRVDLHVVETRYLRYQRFYRRYQQFICNKQLFNLSCKLCNMKKRLKRQGNLKETEKIRLRRYSFLNIIDRDREHEGVKIWMAPISAWNKIRHHHHNEYHPVNYFDTPPDEERGWDQWSYGWDLKVFFNPEEEPRYMYTVDSPLLDYEPTPLGTEEQKKRWAAEMLPLLPENFYDPIELKGKELKLLEENIAELVSREEFVAYIRSPEYEARMERIREEKEKRKAEEMETKRKKMAQWKKLKKEWNELLPKNWTMQ